MGDDDNDVRGGTPLEDLLSLNLNESDDYDEDVAEDCDEEVVFVDAET